MAAMTPARRFPATVLLGSVFLALAAFLYARILRIPAVTAIPLAAAFLFEFPFYLLPGFLNDFDAAKLRRPALLAVSCLLPYLVYSIPTGEFGLTGLALLSLIAATLAFWYVLFPPRPVADLLFLAIASSIYISKVFDQIYISPLPKLQISPLGHIMLIRTCVLAILIIRPRDSAAPLPEFRFLPTLRESLVGMLWFVPLAPACALALFAVKLNATPHPARNLWLLLPEFLGILWLVALSEEFLFRGLLQQWFEKWTASPAAGLILASLLFGSAHLAFAHVFPNWRFAIVAAVFGVFCGLAWRQTRTIQSAMVTHALAATLYRVFFQ